MKDFSLETGRDVAQLLEGEQETQPANSQILLAFPKSEISQSYIDFRIETNYHALDV